MRILAKAVARNLYPKEHPYASTLLGDEKALKQVSAADLRRFHAKYFQPDHATIAFAGDITLDAAAAKAEQDLRKVEGQVAGRACRPASRPRPTTRRRASC